MNTKSRELYPDMARSLISTSSDIVDLPVVMVLEVTLMSSVKMSEFDLFQQVLTAGLEKLREHFSANDYALFVRGGTSRPATPQEIQDLLPRKKHMRKGEGWLCATTHVSEKSLTSNETEVTCKLCLNILRTPPKPPSSPPSVLEDPPVRADAEAAEDLRMNEDVQAYQDAVRRSTRRARIKFHDLSLNQVRSLELLGVSKKAGLGRQQREALKRRRLVETPLGDGSCVLTPLGQAALDDILMKGPLRCSGQGCTHSLVDHPNGCNGTGPWAGMPLD